MDQAEWVDQGGMVVHERLVDQGGVLVRKGWNQGRLGIGGSGFARHCINYHHHRLSLSFTRIPLATSFEAELFDPMALAVISHGHNSMIFALFLTLIFQTFKADCIKFLNNFPTK